jgi:hypothetical protein
MSIPAAWPQVLDFFGTPLVIEPSSGQLSSPDYSSPSSQDCRPGASSPFVTGLQPGPAPDPTGAMNITLGAWEKKKSSSAVSAAAGSILIGMPDPLGCEFSLWQSINPTV